MKTQKKASPGNGKNNKVKNNRKQSGHSGRFAKSLLLTEGLLIRSGSYGFNGHSTLAEKQSCFCSFRCA